MLKSAVQDLGTECSELVRLAGKIQSSPDDQYAKMELSQQAKKVTEKVCIINASI